MLLHCQLQSLRQRAPMRIQAARVAGVDIPNQKRIEFSLQYIFGIGPTTAKAILVDTVRTLYQPHMQLYLRFRVSSPAMILVCIQRHHLLLSQAIENKRTRELSEEELTTLREEVEKYTVEGDLRRFNSLNIKRLKEIGCYRGRRHVSVGRPLF